MNKWIVDIKGAFSEGAYEITVLRESNKRGKDVFGLIGKNKHMVASSRTTPRYWPLTKIVWDKLIVLAQEVADGLNTKESND